MSTETTATATETTIAAFSHAVTMQTRELRLKSRAVKAGNFGNAGHHATEASKWAMTAWSLAGNLAGNLNGHAGNLKLRLQLGQLNGCGGGGGAGLHGGASDPRSDGQ